MPITRNYYWAEGPTVLHVHNGWIVYFDKYTQHTYGAVESGDLKNWLDISNTVRFPQGARHGTVFTVSRAEYDRLTQALAASN